MAHPLLFYTLLALWLLPAIALIVVYCADVMRDKVNRWWVRWTCYRARQVLLTCDDPQSLITLRRSIVVDRTQADRAHVALSRRAVHGSAAARPYLVMGGAMRVPLVLEDEVGNLHTKQWELSLN
jgi:hypothetical protein